MRSNILSVTEMARNFSEILGRVAYRRERFVLRKGRKAVAEIRPLPNGRRLGDLPAVLGSLPRLSNDDALAFLKDVDDARTELNQRPTRDPWAS